MCCLLIYDIKDLNLGLYLDPPLILREANKYDQQIVSMWQACERCPWGNYYTQTGNIVTK